MWRRSWHIQRHLSEYMIVKVKLRQLIMTGIRLGYLLTMNLPSICAISFDVIFENGERLETFTVSTGYKTVLEHQLRQLKLKLFLIM
jgi:hypothetical protein